MIFPSLAELHSHLGACHRCAEAGYPVIGPPICAGQAGAAVMIVGQAPGRVEVGQTKRPFSGPAGKRLFRWLAEAGWNETEFRTVNYMTAITKCYPGPHPDGRGDRVPSRVEQELCRPWLEQELALVRPQVIVPVGSLAIARFLGNGVRLEAVIGRVFSRPMDDARLSPWAQRHAPDQVRIVPLPHPSGASQWFNVPANQELLRQALAHLRPGVTKDC